MIQNESLNPSALNSSFTLCPNVPVLCSPPPLLMFAMILTAHAHMAGSLSRSQEIVPSSEKPTVPQELENCLRAKSVLRPPHPFVYFCLCCFRIIPADVNHHDRHCLANKVENSYYLALHRKGLLTPTLQSRSTWDTVTLCLGLPSPPDCEHLRVRCGPL